MVSSTYRSHMAGAVALVAATVAGVLTAYLVAADAGVRQNITAFSAFLFVYALLRFFLRRSRQRLAIDLCAMLTAYALFIFVAISVPDRSPGWFPFSFSITTMQYGFFHIRALKNARASDDVV